MKKWYAAVSACILLFSGPHAEAKSISTMPMPIERRVGAEEAAKLFESAFAAYIEGKRAVSADVRSEKYADAILAVSQAAKLSPGSADVMLLASQIYRSKGGASYAKEYFARAESLLLTRLSKSSDPVGANLDYAIACYAGDARFGDSYERYLKTAYRHAGEVIRIARKKGKKANAAELRAMALAYLIKGDEKRCEQFLKKSSDETSKFYIDLFNETVKQEKWIWPVGKDSVKKEFLMYFLLNSYSARRAGL